MTRLCPRHAHLNAEMGTCAPLHAPPPRPHAEVLEAQQAIIARDYQNALSLRNAALAATDHMRLAWRAADEGRMVDAFRHRGDAMEALPSDIRRKVIPS